MNKADHLLNQGAQQLRSGDLASAYKSWQRAASLYESAKDNMGLMKVNLNLGSVARMQGRANNALGHFKAALDLAGTSGDSVTEAKAAMGIGSVYAAAGHSLDALGWYARSLKLTEGNDRTPANVTALIKFNIGHAMLAIGQVTTALANFSESVEIARENLENFDVADFIAAIDSVGLCYIYLGQPERALPAHDEAIDMAQRNGFKIEILNARGNQALALSRLNRHSEATSVLHAVVAEAHKIGAVHSELQAMILLCEVLGRARQDMNEAKFFAERAVTLAAGIDERARAVALNTLGTIEFKRGDLLKAAEAFRASLHIKRKIGDKRGTAGALANLGVVEVHRQAHAAALPSIEEAVSLYESLRADAGPTDAYHVFMLEEQAHAYQALQQARVSLGDVTGAFAAAEQGRSRASVSLINALRGDIPARLAQPPDARRAARLAKQLSATIIEYSIIFDEEFGSRFPPAPSRLYIWAIQPDGSVHFRDRDFAMDAEVAAGRPDAPFEDNLTKADLAAALLRNDEALTGMYAELIEPIAEYLPANDKGPVIIVPHRFIFHVPFNALHGPGEIPLLARHTISVVPSVHLLEILAHRNQARSDRISHSEDDPVARSHLVVGNPKAAAASAGRFGIDVPNLHQLPEAEEASYQIAELLGVSALVRDKATKSAVLQKLPDAISAHFGTHALLDAQYIFARVPGVLALTPGDDDDGFLTSEEILEHGTSADVVVLGACVSGLGHLSEDGVLGLARAFLCSGTNSVVATLWSVYDHSSAAITIDLTRRLIAGEGVASAMRGAVLAERSRHADPAYWAGFVTIGLPSSLIR